MPQLLRRAATTRTTATEIAGGFVIALLAVTVLATGLQAWLALAPA